MSLIRFFATFLLIAACASPFSTVAKGSSRKQSERQHERTIELRRLEPFRSAEGFEGRLRWSEYAFNTQSKGEPLLLVVLGGRNALRRGEAASEVPAALTRGADFARNQIKNRPVYILLPEAYSEGGDAPRRRRQGSAFEGLPKVVRERAEAHRIKPESIRAAGFSMGGGALWSLLNEDPFLFRKAVIVGASGDPSRMDSIRAQTRAYHGDEDQTIPLARAQTFAAALETKRPGQHRLEVLKRTGHAESEQCAFAKPALWQWLLN